VQSPCRERLEWELRGKRVEAGVYYGYWKDALKKANMFELELGKLCGTVYSPASLTLTTDEIRAGLSQGNDMLIDGASASQGPSTQATYGSYSRRFATPTARLQSLLPMSLLLQTWHALLLLLLCQSL
jgi:hypothetical protein